GLGLRPNRHDGFERRRVRAADTRIEGVVADEPAQREIRFERCARRADADHAPGEHARGPLQRLVDAGRPQAVAVAHERTADAGLRGDEAVPVAASVADEIAVHVAVVAIHDAPQAAVAFLRGNVAADAAMHAD